MKISELISELSNDLVMHGDLEVVADTSKNKLVHATLVAYLTREGSNRRERVCFLMLEKVEPYVR